MWECESFHWKWIKSAVCYQKFHCIFLVVLHLSKVHSHCFFTLKFYILFLFSKTKCWAFFCVLIKTWDWGWWKTRKWLWVKTREGQAFPCKLCHSQASTCALCCYANFFLVVNASIHHFLRVECGLQSELWAHSINILFRTY